MIDEPDSEEEAMPTDNSTAMTDHLHESDSIIDLTVPQSAARQTAVREKKGYAWITDPLQMTEEDKFKHRISEATKRHVERITRSYGTESASGCSTSFYKA